MPSASDVFEREKKRSWKSHDLWNVDKQKPGLYLVLKSRASPLVLYAASASAADNVLFPSQSPCTRNIWLNNDEEMKLACNQCIHVILKGFVCTMSVCVCESYVKQFDGNSLCQQNEDARLNATHIRELCLYWRVPRIREDRKLNYQKANEHTTTRTPYKMHKCTKLAHDLLGCFNALSSLSLPLRLQQ